MMMMFNINNNKYNFSKYIMMPSLDFVHLNFSL